MSGQASRESSIPSVSEVVVTKRMDKIIARPVDRLGGRPAQHHGEDRIHHNGKGETTQFLNYELTNTGLSGYSVSSGGDMPTESLSLNFTKVVWSFTGTDPAVSGTPVTQGYDLTTAKTT